MRAIFVANDLLDIVNGTTVKPETTGEQQTTWLQENAKAMVLLSSTMHYSQLKYLIACDSAAEMWAKLSAIYEQSATSKLLFTRFHEYSMKPGDSISQHIAKVENMARELKAVGEEISDITIMAKILGSLPVKYNAFVTAWNSAETANQTIFNLTQGLIKEETQFIATETTSALATVNLKQHKEGLKKKQQQGDGPE